MTVALLSSIPLRASQRKVALKDLSVADLVAKSQPSSLGAQPTRSLLLPYTGPWTVSLSRAAEKALPFSGQREGHWTQIFWRWASCLSEPHSSVPPISGADYGVGWVRSPSPSLCRGQAWAEQLAHTTFISFLTLTPQ